MLGRVLVLECGAAPLGVLTPAVCAGVEVGAPRASTMPLVDKDVAWLLLFPRGAGRRVLAADPCLGTVGFEFRGRLHRGE